MRRIEEIYEFILPLIKEHGFEDTTQHRYEALLAIKAAWTKMDVEPDEGLEKILYIAALDGEIFHLKLQLMFSAFFQRMDAHNLHGI